MDGGRRLMETGSGRCAVLSVCAVCPCRPGRRLNHGLRSESPGRRVTAAVFQSKNNRPLRTGQLYAQDENATHTQLYTSHFDLMKMTAGKRSPPIKPL